MGRIIRGAHNSWHESAEVLYQGTTLVVPNGRTRKLGFSPCHRHSGAKAQSLYSLLAARLKPCPDTNRIYEECRLWLSALLVLVAVGLCPAQTAGRKAASSPELPANVVTLASPSPLYEVEIMVRAGSAEDPAGKEGTASLLGRMMLEGGFGDPKNPVTKETGKKLPEHGADDQQDAQADVADGMDEEFGRSNESFNNAVLEQTEGSPEFPSGIEAREGPAKE